MSKAKFTPRPVRDGASGQSLPKGLYGLQVTTAAFAPVLRPGDTALIDPGRKRFAIGHDCLLSDGKVTRFGHVVGVSTRHVTVEEYMPPRTRRLSRGRWRCAGRVFGRYSR